MDNDKKKKVLLIIGSLTLIIALLGSAYAFFTYFKSHEAYAITSLNIKAEFIEGTNSVTFKNAYPISDEFALQNLDKLTYIDFTVTSEIGSESQAVEYEIYLEEEGNTLDSGFVKVYLTDNNNQEVIAPQIYSELDNTSYSASNNGKVVYKDNNSGTFTKNYRLYVWLDSNYEQNEVSETFKFKVNLYAYNEKNKALSSVIKTSIEKNTDESCNPIIKEDGIIYFSGTNDCVDFNYIWYSGKLWRITSINPDGTMKMVTEDMMTAVSYGSTTTYSSSSYMYQWLNQEFLPTLYNYEKIIDVNYGWDATPDSRREGITKPNGTNVVNAPVGLLNLHEYYQSFQNADKETGYLKIGYMWELLTPYDDESINAVYQNGSMVQGTPIIKNGVRPSISLLSTVKMESGDGTIDNPYIISQSYEEIIDNHTLINTRVSGEYIKLEGDDRIFRIVGTEKIGDKLTTKIVLNDFVKESESVVTKNFSSSADHALWTKISSTDPTYWNGYLNTTWLSTLDKDLLEQGTYYLGSYTNGSYKVTVCSTAVDNVIIKECIENNNVVSNKWTGYVGILRIGEMFATQPEGYTSDTSTESWLITPYNEYQIHYAIKSGMITANSPQRYLYAARPSINLTSYLVIKEGSGTKQDPFVVGFQTK